MNCDVQHRMELMRKRAAGYKSFSSKEEATVKVLFASESGTAESLAREFADACQLSHGAEAMNDIDDVDEINGSTTIFFVSTAGQGSMPRNGIEFLKQLTARKESFAEGTCFSIMGLGDSSYYFFLKAAKDLEKAMLNLGAKCIYPLGEGDDSCAEGLEEGLQQWQEGIFPALGLQKPAEVPHITPVDLLFSKRVVLSEVEDKHAVERYYESIDAKEVRLSSLAHISEEGHNRDFITFTFQTGSKNLSYSLGDSLEIFPKNDEAVVGSFLHEYSTEWDERTVLELSHAFGVHGKISIGAVFTNMLDIFGKPNMAFLQKLATFEEDAEKRKVMLDPANLRQFCLDRCVTYADLLLIYKSARPPLAALLAMIPTIKGRSYSITTTPSESPDSVELCVLIDTFWSKEGVMRYGTTSNMLRKLEKGNTVFCRVKPGSMEPPRHDQSGK